MQIKVKKYNTFLELKSDVVKISDRSLILKRHAAFEKFMKKLVGVDARKKFTEDNLCRKN
jgi:hypothetical protein